MERAWSNFIMNFTKKLNKSLTYILYLLWLKDGFRFFLDIYAHIITNHCSKINFISNAVIIQVIIFARFIINFDTNYSD